MKILLVTNDYHNQTNGLSISTQRFAAALRQRGNDVRVAALAYADGPDYGMPPKAVPLFGRIVERQGYHFARCDHAILREGVLWADVVHIEDPFALCRAAAIEAERAGKPCTGSFHLYPENITYTIGLGQMHLLNAAIMLAFGRTYRHCTLVHCPTQKVAERLARYHYPATLRVISNGVAPYTPVECKKPPTYRDKFVILCTGRLSNEKHQSVLLRAIPLCRHKREIQLVLAGQGPNERRYRRLGRGCANPPAISFLPREELQQVLAYADLYVHCATVEVEGLSCLEAIAAGVVPLIASGALSATDVYALGEKHKFAAHNKRMLADLIDYWIEHPAERQAASARYKQYAQGLSVAHSAEQLQDMMKEAVDTSPRPSQ